MQTDPILRTVDRHIAVACLLWRPLPGVEEDPWVEVRQLARQQSVKHGVLDIDETQDPPTVTLGLVPPETDPRARRGVSAAMWLASAMRNEPPLIYTEALSEGRYWIILVHNGVVDARTDVIRPGRQAGDLIESLAGEYLSMGQVRFVHATDQYPSTGMLARMRAQQSRFEDLVAGVEPPKEARIDQLVGIRPATYIALAAAVAVLALLGGVWKIFDHLAEVRRLEVERAQAERDRIAAQDLATRTEIAIARAVTQAARQDTATPDPRALLHECAKVYAAVGDRVAGWQVTSITCQPTGATAELAALGSGIATDPSLNSHLFQWTRARGWPVPSIGDATRGALLTIPAQQPDPRPPVEITHFPPFIALQEHVVTRLQMLTGNGGYSTASMDTPMPRSITYIDPSLQDDPTNPLRVKTVPPERGYLQGRMSWRGNSLAEWGALTLEYPFLTITSIRIEPRGGDASFSVEASYVAKS